MKKFCLSAPQVTIGHESEVTHIESTEDAARAYGTAHSSMKTYMWVEVTFGTDGEITSFKSRPDLPPFALPGQ